LASFTIRDVPLSIGIFDSDDELTLVVPGK